jgi:hypothetical protein
MGSRLILLMTLVARAATACECQASASPCGDVAQGAMVFIGTVESISPQFLDFWNPARRQSLREILDAEAKAQQEGSSTALAALKKKIQATVPDLPSAMARRLAAARTRAEILGAFDRVLNGGRVVRFRVRTLFAGGGDDDDDDDAADESSRKTLEVTTPFDDCGYPFQQGETYLVYARRDEESNEIETSACTATKRLSDAGPDLPFLYFHRMNPKSDGHLDGVTRYVPLYGAQGGKAATGLVVGIRSGELVRYTTSDALGRFSFDGLAPGDYSLRVWSPGYPEKVELLAGPSTFAVYAKSCIERQIAIPTPPKLP